MPTFNLYPRFAYQVASGAKRQAVRARPVRVGELVHLFCGGNALGAWRVTSVHQIRINYAGYLPSIQLDGIHLSMKNMEDFARRDGFPGLEEFIHFYAEYHDLPFKGFVVEWDLQEQAVAV